MSSTNSFAPGRNIGGPNSPTSVRSSRYSLATRIIASLLAITLIVALVGGTGLYFIDNINKTLNNITDVAAPTVETSDDLISLVIEANKVAEEIIADEDLSDLPPLIEELANLNNDFNSTYKELRLLAIDESLLDELHTAESKHKDFVTYASKMTIAHEEELHLKVRENEILNTFDDIGSELIVALDEFAEENEAEMAKAEDEGDRLALENSEGAAINEVLGQLFDEDYPVVESALKLQRLIIEMQDTAGEYIAETRPEKLGAIEDNFNDLYLSVRPHLDVLTRLAETEEENEDIANIEKILVQWVALSSGSSGLFEVHQQMLRSETLADHMVEEMENDADNVADALDRVAEFADAISDGADEAAEEAIDQARASIAMLLALAMLVSGVLIAIVIISVIRPIKTLTEAMIDLSRRFNPETLPPLKEADEVSQLLSSFNHMAQQLELATEGLESTVRQRTKELEKRSGELDAANKDLETELENRQSLEQQLVQAQKLDGLGTLAGGIAHDFNNMLYVIIGCTELALDKSKKNKAMAELLEKIDEAAQRSKSIVNQILFFSRQEQPIRDYLDLGKATEESITLLRAGIPTTVILDTEIIQGDCKIYADETQIQQVIVNLVTNSFHAISEGKGKIEVKVDVTRVSRDFASKHVGMKEGDYARLTIKDNGVGITREDLSNVFNPFFTTKPVGEGTGLGLSVVHGIITSHSGVITVDSTPNVGTTFSIYLPSVDIENTDNKTAD